VTTTAKRDWPGVAEDRNLLHPLGAAAAARKLRYASGFVSGKTNSRSQSKVLTAARAG